MKFLNKETRTTLLAFLIATPFVTFAQTYAGLVGGVVDFINILIPAMFAIVFVILIWRVIDAWVIHAGDPAKREEGKRMAITAVIVLVIAVSVWGIVQIIRVSFLGT